MNKEDDIIDDDFIKIGKDPQISFALVGILGIIGFIGIAFKILHWPLGDESVLIGWGGLCGYLTAITFFLKSRKYKIWTYLIILLILLSILFRFPYNPFILMYFGVVAVFFLLTFIILSRSKKQKQL